jgi:hypothetical protein
VNSVLIQNFFSGSSEILNVLETGFWDLANELWFVIYCIYKKAQHLQCKTEKAVVRSVNSEGNILNEIYLVLNIK